MKITLLIFSLLFIIAGVNAQVNDNKIRQQVLNKSITDSTFIFGKWNTNGNTETHLKYLGEVRTVNGTVFKLMNSIWVWGLSHRATNRILVFNNKNQFVGNYYVTTTDDLPDKLENNKLIFTNSNKQTCDIKLITEIDFSNGLPKSFFIKCKGTDGDIYTFGSD